MQCDYFDSHRCRSCTLMGIPYAVQLADKVGAAQAALGEVVPHGAWLDAYASPESGFRNKAKLVVGGEVGAVTLGILDRDRRGIDLQGCGVHEATIAAALPRLAEVIDSLRLLPYDVSKARGELKNLHVTSNPAGRLMVRFVLRSDRQAPRLREAIRDISAWVPGLQVATINYLPEHVALLEGADEEYLTGARTLPFDLGDVTLHVGPQSFFQTNTLVAQGLYETARSWLAATTPSSVLDLYCGVGGFGLFAATLPTPPSVTGVETSPDAVASARHTLDLLRADGKAGGPVDFIVADVADVPELIAAADSLVVNPPRRGLGADLAGLVERSNARTVIYSSCNPQTLATDLGHLASFRVERAQLFDMFPQTNHSEVLVLATR